MYCDYNFIYIRVCTYTPTHGFQLLSISTVNTGNVIQNNKNKDANNMLPGKAVKQMVAHSQKTIQNLRIKTEPIMVGADATVYSMSWFKGQICIQYVYKKTLHPRLAFYAEIHIFFDSAGKNC